MTAAVWCLLVATLAAVVVRQADGIRADHRHLLTDLEHALDRHLGETP